jgi:hypothetical protein
MNYREKDVNKLFDTESGSNQSTKVIDELGKGEYYVIHIPAMYISILLKVKIIKGTKMVNELSQWRIRSFIVIYTNFKDSSCDALVQWEGGSQTR